MNADSLLAHSAACWLLGSLLRPEVDRDLLRRCATDQALVAWPVANSATGLDLMASALRDLSEEALERIERDNTELFIGPERPIPLWESVWSTEEALLFADCEADVSLAFARHGFAVPANEPADHLSYELRFLAALLAQGAQAADAGDAARSRTLVAEAVDFLTGHLGRWAGACLRQVEERAATDLYRGAARAGADLIEGLLGRLPAPAPEAPRSDIAGGPQSPGHSRGLNTGSV